MRFCLTFLLIAVHGALPSNATASTDEGDECEGSGDTCAQASGTTSKKAILSNARYGWYGWRIWAADASSAAIGLAIMSQAPPYSGDASPRLGYVSATWRLSGMLAAPAIHFLHGNVSRGLVSMAMRIGMPWPFLVGLYGCRYEYSSECMQKTSQWISLASLVTISALDGAFLARTNSQSNRDLQREWYGWQGLIVDGAALGVGLSVAIASADRQDQSSTSFAKNVFLPVWAIGVIGGPVVHWSHGRVGVGLASLALRLFGGIAMAAVPLWISDCIATHSLCRTDELEPMLGWSRLSGQLAVTLLDDLVLARRDRETPASTSGANWYFTPTLQGGFLGASF